MKPRNGLCVLSAAVFALCGFRSNAEAGVIVTGAGFDLPGASTGIIGPIGATPAPNNDNATLASPNTIPYSVFFNTFGVLESDFLIEDSGGSTEYRFTQTFINNTGIPWGGFLFELGFGAGADFVGSSASDALDFDTPDRDPAPSASAFSGLTHQPDLIRWVGGTVPSIGVVAFSFAIDIPDNLLNLHPGGLNRFTLRQTPLPIPEPTGTLLVAAGLAAVSLMARTARDHGRGRNARR